MTRRCCVAAGLCLLLWFAGAPEAVQTFDHSYASYAQLLARHVRKSRVDYAALQVDRAALDDVIAQLDGPSTRSESTWTRAQRLAFWINAYNAFTLRAIIEAYPIRARGFTIQPRNSIRQIDRVWSAARWRAAGRSLSLDDIEHRIVRPVFQDARAHFALNCASVSCPPLAAAPYRADTLDARLDEAARRYLASAEGLVIEGDTFRVSSLFRWYGDDFIKEFGPLVGSSRPAAERAILGVISRYGPPGAVSSARQGTPRLAFLRYDWSLNDIAR